jgi:ribosomal protein S18 acetylase RimI-like enzyme
MIEIRPFPRNPDEDAVEALELHFNALYSFMATKGLSSPIVPGGARMWTSSVLPMLDRLVFIFGAWEGEQMLGFVAGTLRTMPAYLGGSRIGALTHIHLEPAWRGRQLGERLFHSLTERFRAMGVELMEVDVLHGNVAGQKFFARMGCKPHHMLLHYPLPA